MSKNKTKRRKVWVNLYPDGRHTMYRTRKEALKIRGPHTEGTVPFVETRPGDVVLSREDVVARKHAAERLESWLKDMKMENDDECDHIRHGCGEVGCVRPLKLAVALLRGGR